MAANSHLLADRTRPSKWRGSIMFLSLSSALVLNMCHRAVASSAQGSSKCIVISGLLSQSAPALMAATAPVTATTEPVTRIDEDWELVITEPDPNLAAPQVQTVMSPFQSLDGFHICFLVNHRNNPYSAVGGLEVQFWSGESQLGARRLDRDVLQQSNETLSWTQRLIVKGDDSYRYLCFRIVNGQSNSWGPFGGSEPLHLNIDTTTTDLSGYSSGFTVANSGVSFSSNRVARLVLKAVRGYSATGELVFEQSVPVVVYDGAPQ